MTMSQTQTQTQAPRPAARGWPWRLAVVVATVAGGGLYYYSASAMKSDSDEQRPAVLFLALMWARAAALVGLGVWWLGFGPGGWRSRLLTVGAGVALAALAVAASDPSIRFMAGIWGVPTIAAAVGLAAAAVPGRYRGAQAGLAAVAGLAVAAPWLLQRFEGLTGSFDFNTAYRWEPTAEERAQQHRTQAQTAAATPAVAAVEEKPGDWPGFRGAKRDSVAGPEAAAGWDGGKPREVWRHPVGPAWSSFACAGGFAFTQEQRGESEAVVCYRAGDGGEVWAHNEPGRHHDDPAGPGPRATPSLAGGRLYAVGATGSLVCLDAATGKPHWTVKLAEAVAATKPVFGLSTSPLVVGDVVVVHAASPEAPRLAAFDVTTGAKKWATDAKGTDSYSSPQAASIDGQQHVLVFNTAGLFAHDPLDGKELWAYAWPVSQMDSTSVQPLVLNDGRVIVGGGNAGIGTRCVQVSRKGDGWAADEAWKTTRFTPKFNDCVAHDGRLYGLDNGRVVCLSLADGKQLWKDGRYGAGQLLLVGDKLLVTAESGQLACVAARPDKYQELWKTNALKGKTWNHPALARGLLLVRNAEEAVAFDLNAAQSAAR